MAYTPGYTARGRRRSDTVTRAIYALVVVTAAAVSVLPLLLLDESVLGPIVQKMKSLPLGAPEDEPQTPSDWGGVEPKRQGTLGFQAPTEADGAAGGDLGIEPDRLVRDVSSDRITRSPELAAPLQRLPSSVEPPPPQPPKPVRYHLVVVEDATTVNAAGTVLKVGEVTGPSSFKACEDGSPVQWSCELRARTALRQLVRSRAIECQALDEDAARRLEAAADGNGEPPEGGPFPASCSVGGTDIASWLVSQGWAQPAEGAPDRLKVLSWIAQEQKRGLWRPVPPTTQ
ncbi:endonuclease YncB(thermonuclease family) [Amorphus suaedae]